VLVENNGRIVDKEELLRLVWPGTCVEEATLAKTVSLLRKALGEDEGRHYIDTVPKRGYRFAVEVKTANGAVEEHPPAPSDARLAYTRRFDDINIWQFTLDADGRRIAFTSGRNGSFGIWVSQSDGSTPSFCSMAARMSLAAWHPVGRTMERGSISPPHIPAACRFGRFRPRAAPLAASARSRRFPGRPMPPSPASPSHPTARNCWWRSTIAAAATLLWSIAPLTPCGADTHVDAMIVVRNSLFEGPML